MVRRAVLLILMAVSVLACSRSSPGGGGVIPADVSATPTGDADTSDGHDTADAGDTGNSQDIADVQDAAGPSGDCAECLVDDDCHPGERCAQILGGSYCAAECGSAGEAACGSGHTCATVASGTGDQVQVCVPPADACGASEVPDAGSTDAGKDIATVPQVCGNLRGPDLATCCKCGVGKTCAANGCFGGWFCNIDSCKCTPAPASCEVVVPQSCGSLDGPSLPSCCVCKPGKTCSPNGCFGGWSCNHDSCKCQPPPTASDCGIDAGSLDSGAVDAGSQDVGNPQDSGTSGTSIGAKGGVLASLDFAIVGDTRPPSKDDLKSYPTAVITKIWQDLQAEVPPVPFAITTGDYQFSWPNGNGATAQLDLYLQARANYLGQAYHTLGNHECTGAVVSNCGPGNKDGEPKTYQIFMQKMMAPLGLDKPWYQVDFQAVDGAWTAKFVFIAANAWSQEQAAWLEQALSQPTTYTFVVRHEGVIATQAPGVTPSGEILKKHPFTLLLVGHTHTFAYYASDREVVTGNGGAPLATGVNYGYVVVRQRADKALDLHVYDYQTHATIQAFAVKPDGSPTK
jgi:hypothetical protein